MAPFWSYALSQINTGMASDKWAHCYISCAATKLCGGILSEVGGIVFEVYQQLVLAIELIVGAPINTDGFSMADILANQKGILCAGVEAIVFGPFGSIPGFIWRESCEDCCNRICD